MKAAKKAPKPLRSASVKTAASGSTRKQATKANAIAMKATFTHHGLRMTRGAAGGATGYAVWPQVKEVEAAPASDQTR